MRIGAKGASIEARLLREMLFDLAVAQESLADSASPRYQPAGHKSFVDKSRRSQEIAVLKFRAHITSLQIMVTLFVYS
jgi:hypothetical protein